MLRCAQHDIGEAFYSLTKSLMQNLQRLKSLLQFLGLGLLLAACGEVTTAPVVITQRATPTAVIVIPTAGPTDTATAIPSETATLAATATPHPTFVPIATGGTPNPLSIPSMRSQTYPGSEITFDQTLEPGGNYNQFIVHYFSEGLKIFGLLTIPMGDPPPTGWPVIIFNHGFIQPGEYQSTVRYEKYVDAMAADGYIVFKPDYRGHGNSEGVAVGGYSSPAYTIDVLNAVASVSYLSMADANRIGMWGHSMGGQITLRAMVATCCLIKAGVIWSGVVAPYYEIISQWEVTPTPEGVTPAPTDWRQGMVARNGTLEQNPTFWNEISPNTYVGDISGPLQIQQAAGDYEVPVYMARELYSEMLDAGRTVFYYEYAGDDHNISHNYELAMQRTLAFFDQYVKGNH